MKSILKTSKNKKIIAVIALTIVIAGSILAYAYYRHSNTTSKKANDTSKNQSSSTTKTDINPASRAQQQTGDQQKQSIINNDQAPQTPSANLIVTITAANQNSSVVSIRALVNAVSNSGTCSLVITSGTSVKTYDASTQALADTSTCRGFDVPTNSLPAGTWHIKMTATIGSSQGIAQKDIVVN